MRALETAAREAPATATATAVCPFKFLDYFGAAEGALLAGRDQDVLQLLAAVARAPVAVLYGRSGLGKSSVLCAGVFPRLVELGYDPVKLRLLNAPIDELCGALGAKDRDDLVATARRRSATKPLVLAFDQFEEIFYRVPDAATRDDAARAIAELLGDPEARVRVIVAVRDDFYGRLGELKALARFPTVAHRLEALSAYGARQAITRPLVLAGVPYEEGLVTSLLDELARSQFEPALLQILATQTWEEAVAQRPGEPVRLTSKDWEGVGGADGAYRRFVEKVMAAAPPERHLLLRTVLDGLIARDTRERTRRAVTRDELVRLLATAKDADVDWALDHLERLRLVRGFDRESARWYELRHERLLEAVEDWLDRDPVFVRFRFARTFVAQLAEAPRQGGWTSGVSPDQFRSYVQPFCDLLPLDLASAELVLDSALCADAEEVDAWAARLDAIRPGASRALVLRMLESGDDVRRIGAIRRGAAVLDRETFVAQLRALALAAPSEEVRRAAGAAFAERASPGEHAPLRSRPDGAAGRARLELLADLLHADRLPAWIGWRERGRVRKALWRRITDRDAIVTWGRMGLLGGFFAAIVAGCLVVGPAVFPVASAENARELTSAAASTMLKRDVAMLALGGIGLCLVPAMVLAMWAARRAARAALERPSRPGWRWALWTSALAWIVPVPVLLENSAAKDHIAEHGVAFTLAIVAGVACSFGLVRWIGRCVGTARPDDPLALWRALAWPIVCAIFPPVAVTAGLEQVVSALGLELHDVRSVSFLIAWWTASAATPALALGLGVELARYRRPLGRPPAEPRMVARAVALAVAALAGATWLAGARGVIPAEAQPLSSKRPVPFAATLYPGIRSAAFKRIRIEEPGPVELWFEDAAPRSWVVHAGGLSVDAEVRTFLSAREVTVAVAAEGDEITHADGRVALRPVAAAAQVEAVQESWTVVRVPLDRDANGTMVGSVEVAAGPAQDGRPLRLATKGVVASCGQGEPDGLEVGAYGAQDRRPLNAAAGVAQIYPPEAYQRVGLEVVLHEKAQLFAYFPHVPRIALSVTLRCPDAAGDAYVVLAVALFRARPGVPDDVLVEGP